MRVITCLIACLIACAASLTAADGGAPTYSIPSQNGFNHDFGVRCPGDVLNLTVTPDSGYTITARVDNGSSGGWVGGPNYTATIPDNFSGVHTGKFTGTYSKAEGSGPGSEAPEWTGGAITNITKVVSTTLKSAADGTTPDTRRTVGVCEEILFKTEPALNVDWTAGAGAPATGSGPSFTWKAPATAQPVTISARCPSGQVITTTIVVIAPTLEAENAYEFTSPADIPTGNAGVGMLLDLYFKPDSVSFGYIEWNESAVAAQNVDEYFANPPQALDLNHKAGTWRSVNDDNAGPFDVAAILNLPKPWAAGSFEWAIPEKHRCKDAGGDGTVFMTAKQGFTLAGDGTTTVAKFGQTATRTP